MCLWILDIVMTEIQILRECLDSVPMLGMAGSSTTCAYVSENHFDWLWGWGESKISEAEENLL